MLSHSVVSLRCLSALSHCAVSLRSLTLHAHCISLRQELSHRTAELQKALDEGLKKDAEQEWLQKELDDVRQKLNKVFIVILLSRVLHAAAETAGAEILGAEIIGAENIRAEIIRAEIVVAEFIRAEIAVAEMVGCFSRRHKTVYCLESETGHS